MPDSVPVHQTQPPQPITASQDALRYLAAVIESSDDAIITKDLNGIITTWNGSAQRLFGYTSDEIVGKPVSTLIPADRQDEEPAILQRLRRGERVDHYETVRKRKDGSLIDISLTVSPVCDATGRIIGASKIARDITELKRTREALARSKEELQKQVAQRTASLTAAVAQMEEFSYSVSHDLRAPVRAMRGFAEAILEECGNDLNDKCRGYLERILGSSAKMDRLIQDVLTFSKLARSEIKLRSVSLQKLIQDTIQNYPQLQEPNAEVRIRGPLDEVVAYESALTQAISNLLVNAVKFVPHGTKPKVQVWTARNNGSVRLWVEDNGIGINPKYQPRLFKMFERVHQNAEYEGTGIGLAIVRKAAEKMGGCAGVESDGMNGSRFWIELPCATKS